MFTWFVLLGLAVGAYGTLIGVGGGFVLMPVLLLLFPRERPEELTAISLAVVFFNALSGSIAYARMRRIHYPSGLLFAAAGLPGAILGASSTALLPVRLFNAVMGMFLLAGAAFLLATPTRGKATVAGPVDLEVPHYNRALGAGLSVVIGFISSVLGLGGGIIHVPVMSRVLKFPVHLATATSHFVLAIMALTGVLVHVWHQTYTAAAWRILPLALGVVAGAQIGAQVSPRIHGDWIMRALAVALVVVAVRILLIAMYA